MSGRTGEAGVARPFGWLAEGFILVSISLKISESLPILPQKEAVDGCEGEINVVMVTVN